MRFVKFKEHGIYIVGGKEYKIEFETKQKIFFIDEDDDIRVYSKGNPYFEIIDRPVMVKAWDDDVKFSSRELIQDLGESFKFRYLCRNTDKDEIVGWENIEYIKVKPKEELTLEQKIEELEKELAELKQQINK